MEDGRWKMEDGRWKMEDIRDGAIWIGGNISSKDS
jgi:hypothetical protein